MRLRDYQRQKCYDAEGDTRYRLREFDKFPQVYRFAYKVLLDKSVSKSIPFMPGVQPGYGMQRGVYPWHANDCCKQLNPNWAWASKYMINLPPWSWSRLVALHEIAHVISLHNYGPHGRIHSPYWASTFLNLLDKFVSTRAANQLQDAFDRRGVEYV